MQRKESVCMRDRNQYVGSRMPGFMGMKRGPMNRLNGYKKHIGEQPKKREEGR